MTVEPVSTLANRINSAILDWSYIGISFTVGHSTSRRGVWERDGSSTVAPRNDSHRWRALRRPGRVHLRSPRQRLRVDVLTDVCQLVVPDRNGENEMVLKRLVRGFDLPLGKADGQNPVSLRYIFEGARIGKRHFFGSLLKRIRHPVAPAVRSSQRPVLARNDPLDVFGDQRQQPLLVATADCSKEVLYGLDVFVSFHSIFSISLR